MIALFCYMMIFVDNYTFFIFIFLQKIFGKMTFVDIYHYVTIVGDCLVIRCC